jgi:hypothetical protein
MEEAGKAGEGRGVILTRRRTVRRLCPHPLLHWCHSIAHQASIEMGIPKYLIGQHPNLQLSILASHSLSCCVTPNT